MKSKQRIFFIGVHNKPNMEPLDSRTKSGMIIDKVIDSVMANLPDVECVKTNLFDLNHVPDDCKNQIHFERWCERVKYKHGDRFVLLGEIVKSCFGDIQLPAIRVKHPATRGMNEDEYIQDVTRAILSRTFNN